MLNKRIYSFSLLLLLYLSQGIPFGFQVTALPVLLRQLGISLTIIGFSSILALPWMLKILWAPMVDRFWIKKIGRRKSWLIPLQSLMFICAFSASYIHIASNPVLFAGIIFVMNLCASIQDIAVDGLAIDVLKEQDLGYGNAIQVVGYKIGMLVSGGFLVWLSSYTGWQYTFIIVYSIIAIPLTLLIFYKETLLSYTQVKHITFTDVMVHLKNAMSSKGILFIIFLIATYKSGETLIDGMFKPFLVDSGFTASQIGLWQGVYGMGASIIGSIIGGIISSRFGIIKGLWLTLIFRLVPLFGEWYCTTIVPSQTVVILVTIAEHLFGGMLTTAMFAFMMYCVDSVIGATHYTLLATIEVIGKSPGMWFSGLLADTIGYSYLFALGIVVSFIPLILMVPIKKFNNTTYVR